jgi:large-conductance mechanosensitive channel
MAQTRRRRQASKTQTVVSGSTIRFEEPSSNRGKPPVVKVVAQEMNPVTGFVGFLREHAVVGLAVGFAIATQAQSVIKQLIASFIDPLYALLVNGEKLSTKTLTLNFHGRTQQFGWGAFVYTLIDFLFVLVAIYVIIKFFNLDKLDKPKKK